MNESIVEAKLRLPLPSLMERLGFRPGSRRNLFCPFHENTRTPAFSIFRDPHGLWRWKCHSQCGAGDEITFLERHQGLSRREAVLRFLALAGVSAPNRRAFPTACAAPADCAPHRAKPSFPPMRCGTDEEALTLANLRGLSLAGLELAAAAGLLRFATLRGFSAWIVTDSHRLNAQARRLDGRPWEHLGGAKAWTLPGSHGAHPLGLDDAAARPCVALVEGGPDLLAACHFIALADRAAALLGATQRIPKAALASFAGKCVRIYPHADAAGWHAARRWREQLSHAGARWVDAFSFEGLRCTDGAPVGDLNDAARIHPQDAAEAAGLLPEFR